MTEGEAASETIYVRNTNETTKKAEWNASHHFRNILVTTSRIFLHLHSIHKLEDHEMLAEFY